MVVYVDIAFLLNCLADAAALAVTGCLSGLALEKKRLLSASLLGGTYGALCVLPGLAFASSFAVQAAAAAALVRLAFGRREAFLRRLLLFFMLSCAFAGAMVAAGRLIQSGNGLEVLGGLNWKVFSLAGGLCFVILSVVFRGGARHGAAGQLFPCEIVRQGRSASLTALLDTGSTLSDGLTGTPALTVHWAALDPLWTAEERAVLSRLEADGAVKCLERLGGGFRLLPYQAVGVRCGMLLCFQPDRAAIDGRLLNPIVIALSPTPVSDGGGYAALWGGTFGKESGHHAA